MSRKTTFEAEDKHMAPFFEKQKVSMETGMESTYRTEWGNRLHADK